MRSATISACPTTTWKRSRLPSRIKRRDPVASSDRQDAIDEGRDFRRGGAVYLFGEQGGAFRRLQVQLHRMGAVDPGFLDETRRRIDIARRADRDEQRAVGQCRVD